LAPRIERVLTKPEILAAYMNVVPHARGMNGFDAAARYFFGVPVNAIRLEEAALLVGMLPAPNDRDPARNPQAALESATRVLERMFEQDRISEAREQAAVSELTRRLEGGGLLRGHATIAKVEIRPYRDLAIAEAAHRGADVEDDYRLIVIMDPAVQGWVVDATERIAGPNQAAGVFIRPTGEVLGIAGSRDYVESSLNRAYRTRQQIGSTGKLFVLVAAYEYGISPNREFPSRSLDGRGWPAEPSRLCKGRDMTLTEALTHSCNRPFTWAAYELAHRLTTVVDRFDLTPPDAPALVPLGGIETSPLRLARAYAAVANKGRLPRIRSLIAALGRRGNVLYAPASYSEAVMSPEIALRVRQALRSPVEAGTARLADSSHAIVYGKTGTTSRDKDALFVGLTNDYVGAFWIGDDHGQGMDHVVGGGAPARAFGWVTDAYYTSKAELVVRPDRDPAGAGWRWMPELLQNREYRYYAWLSLFALVIGLTWSQLRRYGVFGWAVRIRLGLRGPVRMIAAPFGWLTRLRLPGLRSK
jgi:penicillin-binding protein 1A